MSYFLRNTEPTRFLSKADLKSFVETRLYEATDYHVTDLCSGEVVVFLSHCHFDTDAIEQTRRLLRHCNAGTYVDSLDDPEMPPITDAKTAEILADRISQCHKFLLIASPAALTSKWVPWELGLAHHAKGRDNIVILPLVDRAEEWPGNEYVGLYKAIKAVDGKVCVYDSQRENDRTQSIKAWLTEGSEPTIAEIIGDLLDD